MARSVRVQPAGAGQLSYDVTSEAAMTAEDLSKLNPGTFCVTLDTGAIYEAYPTGKTAPPGATTIAAVSGSWVLQTSAGPVPGTPAYNPAWYALTAIYWDPSNVSGLASDANSGATAILPVLTWAEIIRRYGSVSPIFNDGQSVTFHKLSPQPNSATDPVFFSPYLSGGGQAVLLDTLQLVQAAFVSGVVTPKNIAIGGSLLTIATMPAGTVAGQLVYNTTRNSYAFVDSVVGTTATMQQPLTAAVATTVGSPDCSTASQVDTWATGDTLTVYACSALNLKQWNPRGADVTAGQQISVGWVQFSKIVDTSGLAESTYELTCETGCNVLSFCQIPATLTVSALNVSLAGPAAGASAGGYIIGCTIDALYLSGRSPIMIGGGIKLRVFASNAGINFRLCPALHGAVTLQGGWSSIGDTFSDATWLLYENTTLVYEGRVWGAYTVQLLPGATFENDASTTFALSLLTAGALKLGSNTTGSYYVATSGQWVGGITISPTTLDTYSGLGDPQIGAKFCLVGGGSQALFPINITQPAPGSDIAVLPLTLTPEAPFADAAVNVAPAPLVVNWPSPVSGANYGQALLQSGGVTKVTLNLPNLVGNNTFTLASASSNIEIMSSLANGTVSVQATAAGGVAGLLGTSSIFLACNTINLQTGGQVTKDRLQPGTSMQFGDPVGGFGTLPFNWLGQTGPNTVACGAGGTQTISAAQAIIPFFVLTVTNPLTSNAVVDFTTNASTGWFLIDVTNALAIGTGGFTLGFKNGTKTQTFSLAQLTALAATGLTMLKVVTYGTNNITVG
jgi:hypothetical protein